MHECSAKLVCQAAPAGPGMSYPEPEAPLLRVFRPRARPPRRAGPPSPHDARRPRSQLTSARHVRPALRASGVAVRPRRHGRGMQRQRPCRRGDAHGSVPPGPVPGPGGRLAGLGDGRAARARVVTWPPPGAACPRQAPGRRRSGSGRCARAGPSPAPPPARRRPPRWRRRAREKHRAARTTTGRRRPTRCATRLWARSAWRGCRAPGSGGSRSSCLGWPPARSQSGGSACPSTGGRAARRGAAPSGRASRRWSPPGGRCRGGTRTSTASRPCR
mmetsp:Transcript_26203/g.87786  ORF Transcript_26203/g.87786 Transcript_26203/m.87786 type:complete len:274 (-) Transcript_26203:449-1270(-)